MTPDASLPPADVQRPTQPLTEEELAQWETLAGTGSDLIRFSRRQVAHLIADLRASRARVKELEAQIAATKAPTQWEYRSRGW